MVEDTETFYQTGRAGSKWRGPYRGLLLNNKQGQTIDTGTNVGDSPGHYAM